MLRALRAGLLAGLALSILSGCSGVTRLGSPEFPYPPVRPPQTGDILHLPTGIYVTSAQMLAAVTDARVVYVGETHDNLAAHRLQLEVLRTLAARYPGQVTLGMEMFTPEQQEALDAWSAGQLSEKEFVRQSRWYQVWRQDFGYYRELLDFARAQRIPVIGLNANKELVRALGRQSPEELPAELRAQLPELDLNDPYQSALVEAIYGGHSAGEAMLDGFHRVQTLWDETMAQNVATWLQDPQHAGMRLVVLAGGHHVGYGFGIPRRVYRRVPTSYALVGSREMNFPEGAESRQMDVKVPEFPMPAYDYLAFVDYEILPESVKLGVMLGDAEGTVEVQGVVPNSGAARAGLQAGDRILRLDGEALADNFDLIYAIRQKRAGDRGLLVIERDGAEQEVEVIFSIPQPHGGAHGKKD